MMWRSLLLGTVLGMIWATCSVSAQDADGRSVNAPLLKMVASAKKNFRPLTADFVETARTQVLTALDNLDAFLKTGAERKRTGWHRYLKWDDLQQELASETPDLNKLQSIRVLFYAQHGGLERAEFTGLRDALTHFMYCQVMASQEDLETQYQAKLDELEQLITRYQQKPAQDDRVAIGRILAWLERASQAPDLVSAIRSRYSQVNLVANVSEELLSAGFSQEVHETDQVQELILGTSIYGDAQLDGNVSLELVPSNETALFDIVLEGEAVSSNVGYNGPATIYSSSWTSVTARKRITLDEEGLHGEVAEAECGTSTQLHDIDARCGLIERVAWKRAARLKPQAERIAASRAAGRIQTRFDSQAGEMLDEANTSFVEKFRAPLLRRDGFPNEMNFRTAEDSLSVEVLRAGPSQLAAPATPPEVTGDHDLTLRLHDSLVSNFSEALLSGETVTDEDLVELFEQAEIEVPEELQISPDKDPWSITFAPEQPIRADFDQDQIVLAIQGNRFTRGDQVIRQAIRISATYQIDSSGPTIVLKRQGDVAVDFVGRTKLSTAQVTMKTFLRRKFEALFEPEIAAEGRALPGRWEKAGRVVLQYAKATGGWLSLGWQQTAAEGESNQVARR